MLLQRLPDIFMLFLAHDRLVRYYVVLAPLDQYFKRTCIYNRRREMIHFVSTLSNPTPLTSLSWNNIEHMAPGADQTRFKVDAR